MRLWPAALVLLAMSAVEGRAQGYDACVQAQLAQMGHDPGDANGVIGPGTAKAAHAAAPDGFPPLSARTAVVWCKALAARDPALAALWPSATAETIWVPPDRSGTGLETVMRRAVDDARSYFTVHYGQRLAGDFTFLAGETAAQVQAAATAHRVRLGRPANGMFARVPMPCGSDTNPRAIAFSDMALFCGAAPPAYDVAWVTRNQTWWTRTVVHEFVHGLQNELAGVHARPRLPSGERTLGPKWLVEGAAEVFEEEFYATRTRFSERSVGTHRRIMKGLDIPLSDLRKRVQGTAHYDVGQYAADLLGARHGRAALFDYFVALRTADSWTQAFEATFDMPLATYEAQFETMRNDLVAAYRFAKGEE